MAKTSEKASAPSAASLVKAAHQKQHREEEAEKEIIIMATARGEVTAAKASLIARAIGSSSVCSGSFVVGISEAANDIEMPEMRLGSQAAGAEAGM